MRLKFNICNPGEEGAGLRGYSDTVVVDVESGDPGGDSGEFMEHLRVAIEDWYDGAGVSAEDITHSR